MKLAVIGSRNLHVTDIGKYIPDTVTEIVSGGARGIDTQAKEFAESSGIRFTQFLPDYPRYGKAAPLHRNEQIADYADEAVAFWDGLSRCTRYTIQKFREKGKNIRIVVLTLETSI